MQLLTQYSPPKTIWNKLTFQKYKVYHCNFCLFLFWVLFNFLKIKWYETKNENKLLGFSYSKNMANVEAFQFSLSFHSAKASYFEEFICKMEKIHKSSFDGKISWRLNLIFSQCVVASYTFSPKWNHFKRFHSLCLCKEEYLIKSFRKKDLIQHSSLHKQMLWNLLKQFQFEKKLYRRTGRVLCSNFNSYLKEFFHIFKRR